VKPARDAHDNQLGFVLHAYPYRETSLIVEAFTQEFGRVPLVARGAKRPRSELRGILNAFQPITLSWTGAGELKTLVRAEWRGGLPLLTGAALLCGFYLNELLLKLLPREDPHAALWGEYETALQRLTQTESGVAHASILRRFELRLLAELGYALQLTHEVDTQAPIDPARRYYYAFDRGARRELSEPGARWPQVSGSALIALAEERYPDAETAHEAKRLMRLVLDHYLESRRIFSRRVVQDLQALEDEP